MVISSFPADLSNTFLKIYVTLLYVDCEIRKAKIFDHSLAFGKLESESLVNAG